MALVFIRTSATTLFVFPVPDSYRWYGDETQTWMLLGWKNLLAHGKLTVPIALGSTLEQAPGLLLGSAWIPALFYGLPQLLFSAEIDPITIGRTVTFIFAAASVVMILWAGRRTHAPLSAVLLSVCLLITTRSFSFASHSARYDMITGFALLAFIAAYWVRLERRNCTSRFAFFFGFLATVAAMAVSPHLEVLLILPALYLAWYFGCFRNWKSIAVNLGGVLLAIAIFVAAYMIANRHVNIGGALTEENQAASYLKNLPIMHPLSWSLQSHQVAAKLYYLWHEAPAFVIVLPLIVASTIILAMQKRITEEVKLLTVCLAGVILSSIYFQNARPYYLIHILPLATLTFVAHLAAWRSQIWMRGALGAAAIFLAVHIFMIEEPELKNAGRRGREIDEANTAAVQAAIEQESRIWQHGRIKPLVLAQAPAVHELLRDTTIHLMTESFLLFPEKKEPVDSTIAREGVDYILDYDRSKTPDYAHAIAGAIPVFSRVGPLLDRTVDYFHDTTSESDTLTLYWRP
jgi:hypothetical protein